MAKKNLTDAAQAATAGMFSNAVEAPQEPQEGRQGVETSNLSSVEKTAQNGPQGPQERRVTNKGKKADDTKVFSFRSWIDEVEAWRLYAEAKCIQIDDLGAAAMREYIKRHPLTADERQIQEAMQRAKKLKSRKQNT